MPPWSDNRIKRLIKTPKLHFRDSGVLAALAGIDADRVRADRSLLGPLLETFVFGELVKQAGWSDAGIEFFHYRTKEGTEVDLVMEDRLGRVVGIEVKASATVTPADFRGLRQLAEAWAIGSRWEWSATTATPSCPSAPTCGRSPSPACGDDEKDRAPFRVMFVRLCVAA